MAKKKIIGKFIDIVNENTYYVKIGNPLSEPFYITEGVNNGDVEENCICFSSEEPVVLNTDMEDTFKHVIIKNAEVNIISNFDLRESLVALNYTDIPLEIRKDNTNDIPVETERTDQNSTLIFSGFVLPFNYNQDYAYTWNEYTIEAADKLGLLQYETFTPEIAETRDYQTPYYFIKKALLRAGFSDNDINKSLLQYDETENTIINPKIFFGDSEDDYIDCSEVLEEIGKVYGIYFYMEGNQVKMENILIFDTSTNRYTIGESDYRSDDTQISISEAYNKIKFTVDLSEIDETFFDPFDEDLIKPITRRAERFISEIQYKNNNKFYDLNNFKLLCERADTMKNINYNHNWSDYIGTNNENEAVYDHYVQVMENPLFDFGEVNYMNAPGTADPEGKNAYKTLQWLYENPGKAGFFSFGVTGNLLDQKNKQVIQMNDMKNVLLIQINGNRGNDASFFNTTIKHLTDQINNNKPICSFEMGDSINLTPQSKEKTNYLVISGKIRLNPITPLTGPLGNFNYDFDIEHYNDISSLNQYRLSKNSISLLLNYWDQAWNLNRNVIGIYNIFLGGRVERNTSDGDDDEKGNYLTIQKWVDNTDPLPFIGDTWPYNQRADINRSTGQEIGIALPYLQAGYDKYKYKGATLSNDSKTITDKIKHIPLLACEMKIGNKYLVEDISLSAQFQWWPPLQIYKQIYSWKTLEECPEVEVEGQVVKQTWFTIGINPGVDDVILGKEFEIENTVSVEMGVNAQGLAIPIPYGSNLVGKMVFKILGPYNAIWNTENNKWNVYWTFWGLDKTQVKPNERTVLSFTENIQITDLSFKLYQDKLKSGYTGTKDNDLVYYSNTNELYKEEKEDELKFCTGLTNEDIENLEIDYKLNNSTILNLQGGRWTGMSRYKTYNNVKLEEARVNEQYNLWGTPRNITETTLRLMDPEKTYLKTNFLFNWKQGEVYRTFTREISLKENTMKCKMKNIS